MKKIIKIYLDDRNRLRLVDKDGNQYRPSNENGVDLSFEEISKVDINYDYRIEGSEE